MNVSECYTLGFGCTHDSKMVVEWLYIAMSHGLRKSALWYGRVYAAVDVDPNSYEHARRDRLEKSLHKLPGELYLAARIGCRWFKSEIPLYYIRISNLVN